MITDGQLQIHVIIIFVLWTNFITLVIGLLFFGVPCYLKKGKYSLDVASLSLSHTESWKQNWVRGQKGTYFAEGRANICLSRANIPCESFQAGLYIPVPHAQSCKGGANLPCSTCNIHKDGVQ